jgi:hypothetical protein
MQFATPQRRVQFTTGRGFGLAGSGNMMVRVRWFNAGNVLLGTRFVISTDFACQTCVNIGNATGPANISRVDIETFNDALTSSDGEFEYIDDLTYRADGTAPVVTITSPSADSCVCNNPVITGVQCDSDGTLVQRRVQYSTSPNGPWTDILVGINSVCSTGALATWDTTLLGSGQYCIRASATNAEGDESEFLTRVFLDKGAPATALRAPVMDSFYSVTVCFDGTVDDGGCSNPTYRMLWRPFAGPTFAPVDAAFPTYTGTVINDPLASNWNVSGLADGVYVIRFNANDTCGNTSANIERRVTVDNTRPTANINSPTACEDVGGVVRITGTAFDANINAWSLQFVGGLFTTWQPLASGTSNITAGTLALWNTAALPPCAYALRLVVTDRASVGCSGTLQSTEFIRTVSVAQGGQCDDIDFNNDGLFPDDSDLISFLSVLAGGACSP